jgi:hypothetical protein
VTSNSDRSADPDAAAPADCWFAAGQPCIDHHAYRVGELNPDASPDDAAAAVTCAADANFTILERDGLVGEAIDARLARREPDGIELLG